MVPLVERMTTDGYQEVGEDQSIAAKFAKQIETKLNQSRANRNIIDDFRAF